MKIHPWPLGITIGLLIVVAVNLGVIWISLQKPHQLVNESNVERTR